MQNLEATATELPASILLVQAPAASDLEAALNGPGQNLVRVSSAAEALDRLAAADFALVLLDLDTPGLDGLEMARRLREQARSRQTPLLFLVPAGAAAFPVEKVYALGAVDHLVKPVAPVVLRARVAVFVELFRAVERACRAERAATARTEAEPAEQALRLLVEASAGLTRSLGLPDVLAAVLDLSHRLIEADAYAIWRLRADESCWEVAHSSGLSEAYLRSAGRITDTSRTIPEEVLAAEDALSVTQLAERRAAYRAEGIAALLVAPLRVHGAVSGTLVFYYHQRRRFDEVARGLAAALANLAAAAIGTAELYERESSLRRRAEEADRRKDEFLALLGHELRNPLAPIRNAVHLLALKGDDPAVVAQVGDLIGRQIGQMTRLVDELLDASRLTRGKTRLRTERLDLAVLVRTTAEDHRPELEATGLALNVVVPDWPLWVEGDPARLRQVVGNLLHNACKFTDPGGRVTLRLTAEDGRAALAVEDSGIGIRPEALPKLFEAFSQADATLERSKGGLGLGLSVVKRLIELHGGRVGAASDGPGKGACFTVWIPLAGEPAATSRAPAAAGAGPLAAVRRRVLIVEDMADAAESLRLLLTLQGFDAAVARTGPEGLGLARRLRPDAVVCDLGLPGLSGFDVARALRADPATAAITLICVSGYGQEQDRQKARAAGFDEMLVKPVDPELLARLLARPSA